MRSVLVNDDCERPRFKRPRAEVLLTDTYEHPSLEPEPIVRAEKPRLEISWPGVPTPDPLCEAHKKAVAEEDEAYARGEFNPPVRDFCSYMIASLRLYLETVKAHVEEMSDAEIKRYEDAMLGLSRSVDALKATIERVQKDCAKRDAIRAAAKP